MADERSATSPSQVFWDSFGNSLQEPSVVARAFQAPDDSLREFLASQETACEPPISKAISTCILTVHKAPPRITGRVLTPSLKLYPLPNLYPLFIKTMFVQIIQKPLVAPLQAFSRPCLSLYCKHQSWSTSNTHTRTRSNKNSMRLRLPCK